MKDRLYLINPDWHDDQGGPWFCPAGSVVEGVLAFYPALREQLEVTYLDFARPRPPVIDEVGDENQSCPLLVLADGVDWPAATTSAATGRRFLQDHDILPYLADRYAIGRPHP